ncbi:DUF305 domain-containing protein [Streptosporangium sp. NPDC048047]|uniref:DUF305 domain-containing protein n=1 Tax=Streptosporangium sp. NPDC048047 TaxID=3155748 RepID=UPI00342C7401
MTRHAVTARIAAGALLAAVAVGVTATGAAGQPTPAPSGSQSACPPTGPGMGPGMGPDMGSSMGPGMGPGGPMHAADNEYAYLARMIPHHREAVSAAEQLRRSDRPELRRLAESIVTTQNAEIAKMRGWLAEWYPGCPAEIRQRPMMSDLSGLSGEALDRTFLREMIRHHMMAVMMSQRLLAHGDIRHPQVAEFARTVRDDQWAEIRRMHRWLTEWYGERGMPHGPMPTPTGTAPAPGPETPSEPAPTRTG